MTFSRYLIQLDTAVNKIPISSVTQLIVQVSSVLTIEANLSDLFSKENDLSYNSRYPSEYTRISAETVKLDFLCLHKVPIHHETSSEGNTT